MAEETAIMAGRRTSSIYVCGVCWEKFTRQLLLAVHLRNRHPEVSEDHEKASTKCAFCQKTLARVDFVVRHERACPDEPPISSCPS